MQLGPAFDTSSAILLSSSQAEIEAEVYSHRPSGGGECLATGEEREEDTPQARRNRILAATLPRLEEQEKEIEDMYGNAREE
jgi:hypothetical protein